MNKLLERLRKTTVDEVCDEGYLELVEDPVPQITVVNCLKMIGSKAITYNNAFPVKKWVFLLKIKVKYVEDMLFTRDVTNIGIAREEMI